MGDIGRGDVGEIGRGVVSDPFGGASFWQPEEEAIWGTIMSGRLGVRVQGLGFGMTSSGR